MNLNLTGVRSQLTALLAAGLTASSLLSVPQAALSSEAQNNPTANQASAEDMSEHFSSAVKQSTFASGKPEVSYLLSPTQDEWISDALLMFLYLILPAGFGLALWQYDKHTQEQLARFTLRIAMLERIWQRNP